MDDLYKGKHWPTGRDWQHEETPSYKSRITLNYSFMATETVVPIMTDREPILEAHVVDKREESMKQSEIVEKAIKYHWRRLKMQLKTPVTIREMIKYGNSVMKPCWDTTTNDVGVELVSLKHLYVDPNATCQEDADYFVISVPHTIKHIKERFPDKAEEIDLNWKDESETDDALYTEQETNKKQMHLKEFWGFVEEEKDGKPVYNIRVITWLGETILENKLNPYWDFKGTLSEEGESMKAENEVLGLTNDLSEYESHHNYFDKQKLPFIIFDTFTENEKFYSATSLIEQVSKIQLAINKTKAQIIDNSNLLANGQWIVDKDSGINANELTNQPGLVVKKNTGAEVRREPGVPLPSYVAQSMEHLESAFDNIFGTHDISRGEKTAGKTATEATLLKDADQGRIALLIRNFNAGIEQLGEWWCHLMKLNYTETHYITILGEEETQNYFEMTQDDIEDGLEVKIKAGSNTPIDRISQREEWKDLARSNLITPEFLYEKMGEMDDTHEEAVNLDLFQKGILYQQEMPQPGMEEVPEDLPPTLQEGMEGMEPMPEDLPETLTS